MVWFRQRLMGIRLLAAPAESRCLGVVDSLLIQYVDPIGWPTELKMADKSLRRTSLPSANT